MNGWMNTIVIVLVALFLFLALEETSDIISDYLENRKFNRKE